MATVLRIVFIYFFLLITLRAMGKREFSQLSSQELVMLLLIPELLSQALSYEDPSLTNAIIAVTTLLTLTFFTSLVMHRHKRMEKLIEGIPIVLVQHGKFVEDAMNRERVTPGEIFAQMHQSGLETLDQVRWAILETEGRIAIVPEDSEETNSSNPDEGTAV
jgi:uncharacterized membrane protein YcaP (DUF421 family)